MFDKLLQHSQRQQKQQQPPAEGNRCNNNEQSVLQATFETHFRHSNYFNGQFIYLFGLWFSLLFSRHFPWICLLKNASSVGCICMNFLLGFYFWVGVLTWLKLRLNCFHVIYQETDCIFNGQWHRACKSKKRK